MKKSDFKYEAGKTVDTIMLGKEFVATLTRINRTKAPDDLLFYAVFDRYGNNNAVFSSLIGAGITTGAFATTLNWGCFQLAIFGRSVEDMVAAVNRVIDMQGGIAVVNNLSVIADIPLSIGGVISDLPRVKLAEKE